MRDSEYCILKVLLHGVVPVRFDGDKAEPLPGKTLCVLIWLPLELAKRRRHLTVSVAHVDNPGEDATYISPIAERTQKTAGTLRV